VLAAHTASFLSLINTALEDISRGVASPHHLHNVRCGIENILSLLKYNNEVVEKADQLSRRAYDYVTYHDLVTSKTSDWTSGEDVDRLQAVREALAGCHSAVEHGQPKSRVRTLRLAAQAGEIDAIHPLPDGPWIFNRAALSTSSARAVTERARQNPKYPTGSHPNQQSLFSSITSTDGCCDA